MPKRHRRGELDRVPGYTIFTLNTWRRKHAPQLSYSTLTLKTQFRHFSSLCGTSGMQYRNCGNHSRYLVEGRVDCLSFIFKTLFNIGTSRCCGLVSAELDAKKETGRQAWRASTGQREFFLDLAEDLSHREWIECNDCKFACMDW